MELLDLIPNLKSLGIEYGTLLMFALLLALLLTGMPLAFVTLLVALIFALGWFGPNAVPLITSRVYSFVSSFVFVSVPMFVLMAALLDRSGIARDLFDAMKLVGGRLRGAVAVQTIFVAVVLAAMSGIIGGEVVLLGLLALPQMLRMGYNRNLAIGVICAGGSLGTMVPPESWWRYLSPTPGPTEYPVCRRGSLRGLLVEARIADCSRHIPAVRRGWEAA